MPNSVHAAFGAGKTRLSICRVRGYTSTLRKPGVHVLTALQIAFAGSPILPNTRVSRYTRRLSICLPHRIAGEQQQNSADSRHQRPSNELVSYGELPDPPLRRGRVIVALGPVPCSEAALMPPLSCSRPEINNMMPTPALRAALFGKIKFRTVVRTRH